MKPDNITACKELLESVQCLACAEDMLAQAQEALKQAETEVQRCRDRMVDRRDQALGALS